MERTLASELSTRMGQRVLLRGWLNNVRSLGKISFLILRDRSGFAQVMLEKPDLVKRMAHLQPGSILKVIATVRASPQAELGYELFDPEIDVEVEVKEPPPIQYYKPEMEADFEFVLDNRALAVRSREIQAIFRIQAEIAHAFRLFMHDEVGAFEYFSPNIIGASSEGGAEFFNVDYFGYTATLAQSSQLYKQIMVGVNERVFALAPFFRAEPSHTPRHLSEGKQLEFEIGFFSDWKEILDIQERCIKFIVKYLHSRASKEIALLGNKIVSAPEEIPFPRVTFKEAQEIYYERSGIDERSENDLSPAAERLLCQWAKEKFGTDLVFVIDWKRSKRPFYSYPKEDEPELTNTFDLLCGGTEITSGGQRRHTYEEMIKGIHEKGLDPAHFTDYLSIFKYGMPPHGGFGMGLERLTMTLLGLRNIREVTLFPSDTKRIAGNRIKAKLFFGGENIRNEIIRRLRANGMEFRHLEHAETPTSEDSARVRGTKMEEGIKALIVRGKNSKKNYQFNIPSHLKLDMKGVADQVGEKCDFEQPEVIEERFGLLVGGIPPFGPLLNLETFFDERIRELSSVAFNSGLKSESIIMKSEDLIALVQPKFGNFTK